MAGKPPLCVFVDEAGDLGFSRRSSKTFVIAYALIENPDSIKKSVRRLKRRGKRARKLGEFKHSKDSAQVRSRLIGLIGTLPMVVGGMVIDKAYVRKDLQDVKSVLYNYLIADKIATALLSHGAPQAILVLDRSMSKDARAHFDQYFRRKVSFRGFAEGKDCKVVEIRHVNSNDEECLQVVDYIAGAMFRYFERGIRDEYDAVKGMIRYTDGWGIKW